MSDRVLPELTDTRSTSSSRVHFSIKPQPVSNLFCLLTEPQHAFFIVSKQCIAFALVYVSCDRLMAVAFFSRYLKLSHRYAWRLFKGLVVYFCFAVPAVVVVGHFSDPDKIQPCSILLAVPKWWGCLLLHT